MIIEMYQNNNKNKRNALTFFKKAGRVRKCCELLKGTHFSFKKSGGGGMVDTSA
ncbi:MAG: hypothetical protein ACTTJ3_07985 [Treponema sp.]